MPNDTHPDVEALLIDMLRKTPVWRKLEMMTQLNKMAYTIAMNGLRERHPQASEAELKRRMAALLYGEELAEKAYGPLSSADDTSDG